MEQDTGRPLLIRQLGRTPYQETLALQRQLQANVAAGLDPDTLLLTEHDPVITLGRAHPDPSLRVPIERLREHAVAIIQVERGGDITYHGPGQLVAYPIIDIRARDIPVTDFIAYLEDAAVRLLESYGVDGRGGQPMRGVWVGQAKVASVGIHVRRGVTMHGIAVNISEGIAGFDLIWPCGDAGTEMTSVAAACGSAIDLDEAAERFAGILRDGLRRASQKP